MPTEASDEPAAAPAGRRGGGSALDMVRSLGIVLLLIGAIALITLRPPGGDGIRVVEYGTELASARVAAPYPVLAPSGLDGYRATSVRFAATDDGTVWHLGYVSPLGEYVGLDQTDGAAAVLLVSAERAEEFTDNPVFVAGFGVATDHPYLHEKGTFTSLRATTMAAERAYAMAGIEPGQIDSAEVHDCFTITEILDIEDLGFCEKGQGGPFTLEGNTALNGSLPVNTSGGLLAKGHPIGATGVAQLTECWWQLREEAGARQVALRHGFALQHNVGGRGSGVSVVNILARDR